MNIDNPYVPPTLEASSEAVPNAAPASDFSAADFSTVARSTFLAWEKMRILFNAILVVISLATAALMGPSSFQLFKFWGLAIFGAIVANLCYFAGPLLDTYVSWLGYPSRRLRWLLFAAGAFVGSLLAMVSIFAVLFELPGPL
ncbi:MAG: hypothetical protein DWQ35_18565 [Planctomycetota bacterium]|nr:MAG: hypothetical protein DWQ35_18565 [Planctomycetota bacterium]REK17715.1 MAG: hypothetical protein DWQ42_21980 [Planctomycetota bacterium]REK46768.1 MAG: hypothetical protein DWQ46_06090 [Planctomycetota bacterium]